MKSSFRYFLIIIVLLQISGCKTESSNPLGPGDDLSPEKMVIKQKTLYNMPGIAAAYINQGVIKSFVSGVRIAGGTDSIRTDDYFHLGSNVKAITGMVMGALMELGEITPSERLAVLAGSDSIYLSPEIKNVTLHQLTTHRSGLAEYDDLEEFSRVPSFNGNLSEQRYQFALWLLSQPPAYTPGEFHYSNAGYIIAAAMMEKRAGKPFEELMDKYIFTPLNIIPRYDWPAAGGKMQPWGHTSAGSAFNPFDPDGVLQHPSYDIPAGNLSLKISDYALIINEFVIGLNNKNGILKASTIRFLTEPNGDYATGWEVLTQSGKEYLLHFGSDNTFSAMAVIDKSAGKAAIVLTNCASDKINTALNDACVILLF